MTVQAEGIERLTPGAVPRLSWFAVLRSRREMRSLTPLTLKKCDNRSQPVNAKGYRAPNFGSIVVFFRITAW